MPIQITLSKGQVVHRLANPPEQGGRWILDVDPETRKARIVLQHPDSFVLDIEGHEDLFPLGMALEREDGFIEGGDWLVARTPDRRENDGWYRSYIVHWFD